MGHVVLALRRVGKALEDDAVLALLPPEQAQRWQDFREGQLAPVLQRHDKPLVSPPRVCRRERKFHRFMNRIMTTCV